LRSSGDRTSLGSDAPARLSRQRVWRIRARKIIIARAPTSGPWCSPAMIVPESCWRTAVIFTTNDSAYPVAPDLADAGVSIAAVVDARDSISDTLRAECERRGITVRTRCVVTGTKGSDRVSHALIGPVENTEGAAPEPVSCHTLLVSGGCNPAAHLFSQARGTLRYDAALGGFVPADTIPGVYVIGSVNGALRLAGCLHDGQDSATAALAESGVATTDSTPLPAVDQADAAPGMVLWRVSGGREQDEFVDVQRDATVADLARACGAGMRSMEHIKRYTTIGTAHTTRSNPQV
jgi:sarcosine oxidase, subunit alpha